MSAAAQTERYLALVVRGGPVSIRAKRTTRENGPNSWRGNVGVSPSDCYLADWRFDASN